jgi:site-specific recombinase XerD
MEFEMNPSTLISDWLATLDKAGTNPKTLAAYQRGLEHFIAWNHQSYNTDFVPANIIQRDIVDWRSYQQAVEGARPATINQRLAALNSFFKWANALGLVTKKPTDGVKGIGQELTQPKALDKRTERLFLRAVHQSCNFRDIAIVELLLGTGLRVSELLDLKIDDLEIGERSGKVTVRMGKHSGYRHIPLTANVRKALNDYVCQHQPQDSLWAGQRGELQDRSAINHILEKYALQAQVKPFGPHTCRHTLATRYLERNPGDLRGLAAILGHRSLNTVMIYTAPTLADLAQRMENTL